MTADDWRTALAVAIAHGLEVDGFAAVDAELVEQYAGLAAHPDAPVEPLLPDVATLALVDCTAGRLGILLDVDGRLSVHLGRTTSAVVGQVQEKVAPGLVVFTGGAEAEALTWTGCATESVSAYDGSDSLEERREQLRRVGLTVPAWFSGSGFTEAELLDACGAVVVGARRG